MGGLKAVLAGWDARAVAFGVGLRRPGLTLAMTIVTRSASMPLWPAAWLAAGLARRNGLWAGEGSGPVLAGLTGACLSLVAGQVLKRIVSRPRPQLVLPGFRSLIRTPRDGSMPSTHASTVAALACGLLMAGSPWWPAAGLWGAAVILSRWYLGVHFPTDLAAGVLIGIGAALPDYAALAGLLFPPV